LNNFNFIRNQDKSISLTTRLTELIKCKIDEIISVPSSEINATELDKIVKLLSYLEKLEKLIDLPSSVVIVFDNFIPWLHKEDKGISLLLAERNIIEKYSNYIWENFSE